MTDQDTVDQLADLGIKFAGGPAMSTQPDTGRTSTPPAPGAYDEPDAGLRKLAANRQMPDANRLTITLRELRAALRAESVAAPLGLEENEGLRRHLREGHGCKLVPEDAAALHAPPALDAATVEQVADALHVIGTCWTAPPGAINREVELEMADALLSALRAATPASGEPAAHVHEWVDARNEVVASGEMCPGCGAIRAGPPAAGAESPR